MLKLYTVIYVVNSEGIQWQYFRCQAENSQHAEEQCINAYPTANILWVNEGESTAME